MNDADMTRNETIESGVESGGRLGGRIDTSTETVRAVIKHEREIAGVIESKCAIAERDALQARAASPRCRTGGQAMSDAPDQLYVWPFAPNDVLPQNDLYCGRATDEPVDTIQYTRTDIHEAVVSERDALQKRMDEMTGERSKLHAEFSDMIDRLFGEIIEYLSTEPNKHKAVIAQLIAARAAIQKGTPND